MSRGHGKTQRLVLWYLARRANRSASRYPRWLSVDEVAGFLAAQHLGQVGPCSGCDCDPDDYDCDDEWFVRPSRAQVESVRRAVKKLAGEGLVEVATKSWDSGDYTRAHLSCRRALTDDERGAEAEALAEATRKSDLAVAAFLGGGPDG